MSRPAIPFSADSRDLGIHASTGSRRGAMPLRIGRAMKSTGRPPDSSAGMAEAGARE